MARSFNGSTETLTNASAVDMSGFQKGAYAFWMWINSYTAANRAALAHYTSSGSNPRVRIFPDNALGTLYVEYVDSAISTREISQANVPAGQWNQIVIKHYQGQFRDRQHLCQWHVAKRHEEQRRE